MSSTTDPRSNLTRLHLLNLECVFDEEAQVWIATSEQVPGLATEADGIEALFTKLVVMIPELLDANNIKLPG